ncbi:hypothetical protein P9747_05695, partial [Paenibacillus macerans]|uniref:hypothetical protein n=1 Tax=Paenibacillus macerans TaxID=44252 RepID=UPI002E2469BA|nr:hypothetical protein [Paenibacillus macerans]
GDPLPQANRAPTESAPCGCGLIEVLERYRRYCKRISGCSKITVFSFFLVSCPIPPVSGLASLLINLSMILNRFNDLEQVCFSHIHFFQIYLLLLNVSSSPECIFFSAS